MKIVNGDDVDGSSCIMTTGTNPYDGSDKMCTDPFKASKRWKVMTYYNDVVDVYFSVGAGETSIYSSLQKLTDGIDNDGDSWVDCSDPDCDGVGICGPEGKFETCSDGLDNDGDGEIDCADSGCAKNRSCR